MQGLNWHWTPRRRFFDHFERYFFSSWRQVQSRCQPPLNSNRFGRNVRSQPENKSSTPHRKKEGKRSPMKPAIFLAASPCGLSCKVGVSQPRVGKAQTSSGHRSNFNVTSSKFNSKITLGLAQSCRRRCKKGTLENRARKSLRFFLAIFPKTLTD